MVVVMMNPRDSAGSPSTALMMMMVMVVVMTMVVMVIVKMATGIRIMDFSS